jgi:hypothetical protein
LRDPGEAQDWASRPTPGVAVARPQFRSMRRPASPGRRQGRSCSSVAGRLRSDAAGSRRLSAWRGISSVSGSGMTPRPLPRSGKALAVLAAHSSASLCEGTSTTQSPPMAQGLGHGGHLLVGDVVHRVGTERDQVSRHPMTPLAPAACSGRLLTCRRTPCSGSVALPEEYSHGTSAAPSPCGRPSC